VRQDVAHFGLAGMLRFPQSLTNTKPPSGQTVWAEAIVKTDLAKEGTLCL
jgi:hypothetical protein